MKVQAIFIHTLYDVIHELYKDPGEESFALVTKLLVSELLHPLDGILRAVEKHSIILPRSRINNISEKSCAKQGVTRIGDRLF